MKPGRILRADRLQQSMNIGKEQRLLQFIRDYRRVAVQIGPRHWRLFFEVGQIDKNMPATDLNHVCGAAPVQMATRQVAEQIKSWISNRANEFGNIVRGCKLPPELRKQLYAINRSRAWFSSAPLKGIDDAMRVLARRIMRHVMAQHRRPDLSRLSPRLDDRIALSVAPSRKAKHSALWATLRLPSRGRIEIPLHPTKYFKKRGGELCPVVQLCTERNGAVGVRLISDITEKCEGNRAAYTPKIDNLGIDFGLVTLLATSEGDLHGRGLLADLQSIDRKITGIARHRQRTGGKPRDSDRYCQLVARVRGMLRTRINRAFNRIIETRAPAELTIERLNFQSPDLSKRMNRILQNCGRAVFQAKLKDFEERFGLVMSEAPSPYTSQECSSCGYVDRRNRRSQSKFLCRFCGMQKHADVNGACTVKGRRSAGLGDKFLTKGAVLAALVRQFCERHPRSQGAAADPRFSNPYFKAWAGAARNALETQGLASCA